MQWMELVNKVLTYRYSYFPPTWLGEEWFVQIVWYVWLWAGGYVRL